MAELDQRKLNLYKWLLEKGKIEYEDIPEPYKSEIEESETGGPEEEQESSN
jgi:hypothetical protein